MRVKMDTAKAKRYLRGKLKQASGFYRRTFQSFSADDLERAMRDVGIAGGDTLFVHSSYDAFQGFSGKPTDVISALQRVVGPSGAVLMPTLPFTSTAVAYVRSNPVFDV